AHDFAARVIAPVFVLVVHALDLQRRRAVGNFGCDGLLEIDEIAVLGELLRQRRRRHVERGGKLAQLLRRCANPVRPGPYSLHRRAYREGLPKAIDDASAMRRDVEVAAVARTALLLQEIVVEALQIERAAEKSGKEHKQRAEDHPRTQSRELRRWRQRVSR